MTQSKPLVAGETTTLESSGQVQPLSVWLFNKNRQINPGCSIINLSEKGAAILVPKNQLIPEGNFDLVVLSPQNNDEILTILNAETRWSDSKVHGLYKMAGVKLHNINEFKREVINILISFMMKNDKEPVNCQITNCYDHY